MRWEVPGLPSDFTKEPLGIRRGNGWEEGEVVWAGEGSG